MKRMPPVIRRQERGFDQARGWEEWGGDEGTERSRYQDANNSLARRIWNVLQQHYPGHPWLVASNLEQGIALIKMPIFTDWSYVIRLAELWGDPGMRMVMKGGGEFLERYKLPRQGIDLSRYIEALKTYQPALTHHLRPPE